MKKIYLILIFSLISTGAMTQESVVSSFVDSIKSVEQVKRGIKDSLIEECGGGHCWNVQAAHVCNLVAGLDIKVGYAITGAFENERSRAQIRITESDLKLMKLVFSQCKPTNYQYWNFSQLLHVVYSPSAKVNAEVNKWLGIKQN